jgi:hypothetical protein
MLGINPQELLEGATILAPRRTFPKNGTAVLTEVNAKESRAGHPTLQFNFVSNIDTDKGINDYLRFSTARDLQKSLKRLTYAMVYGGNAEACESFVSAGQSPILFTDVAGNVVSEPQWVMFNVEPTEDGKTAVPSDKVGEYLIACREANADFDFIETDVKDEAGNFIGRKFCPAKVDKSELDLFVTKMHTAFSKLVNATYYIETRMSKDEKYQNVSHIKAVN